MKPYRVTFTTVEGLSGSVLCHGGLPEAVILADQLTEKGKKNVSIQGPGGEESPSEDGRTSISPTR
jgi:hypothetical protein